MSYRPKIVLLGMMTRTPVAGVVWQTVHYLIGFQRLGFDPYYVEAHARTPAMLMTDEADDSGALGAAFVDGVMRRFGLAGRWAYQALHDDERLYGMSESELRRLYSSAELIVNLHGGTEPRPEHYGTGRLVYLETDPVQLQIELHDEHQYALDFLEPHVAFFTFGENYGRPGCGLPVSDRFTFHPTRQPVVTDFWLGSGNDSGLYTTIGNWRQLGRDVTFDGERYGWSKDEEFRKFLALPSLTGSAFELALSRYTPQDRELLESRGWRVRPALDFSSDLDAYRGYIRGSRAEFTVAKDQNVRLRTGWFSDRGATYLAAGRPVVTQDTGFGDVLPTGRGPVPLLRRSTTRPPRSRRSRRTTRERGKAAFELAREHFDASVVLGQLLDTVGMTVPGRHGSAAAVPATARARAAVAAADNPPRPTVDAVLARPIPETGGDRLGRRRHDCRRSSSRPRTGSFSRDSASRASCSTPSDVDIELIVVDNGSRDGTREYLAALAERDSRIRMLRNEENRGFAPAVNQGLARRPATCWSYSTTTRSSRPARCRGWYAHVDRSEIGLVGATTNRCGNEAEVDAAYRTYGQMIQVAERRAAEHRGVTFDIEVATLFCAAMRRDTHEHVGLARRALRNGPFRGRRLLERGSGLRAPGRLRRRRIRPPLRRGGVRGTRRDGRYGDLFRANKARFEEKWGIPWQSHLQRPNAWYRDLIDRIRDVVERELPPDATVLVVSNGDDELLKLGAERPRLALPAEPGRHVRRPPPGRFDRGDRAPGGASRQGRRVPPATRAVAMVAGALPRVYGDAERGPAWDAHAACALFDLRGNRTSSGVGAARPGRTSGGNR